MLVLNTWTVPGDGHPNLANLYREEFKQIFIQFLTLRLDGKLHIPIIYAKAKKNLT